MNSWSALDATIDLLVQTVSNELDITILEASLANKKYKNPYYYIEIFVPIEYELELQATLSYMEDVLENQLSIAFSLYSPDIIDSWIVVKGIIYIIIVFLKNVKVYMCIRSFKLCSI